MLRKISGTFLVRFASALINLLIAIIISRYLGAPGKGEQGIFIATISFIILFDNIVGGATVVYLTPRLKLKGIILVSYVWSFLVSVASYLLLSQINIVPLHFLLPVVLLSGLSSFISINSSVLLGKEQIWKSNLVGIINPFITIISVIILFTVFKKVDIYAYFTALFLSYSLGLLVSILFVFPYVKKSEKIAYTEILDAFKLMVKYGYQNQLGHVFHLLNVRLSYYFLESYWGSSAVGVYSNGVSLIESVWMIASSITIYQYSRIVNSNDSVYSIKLTETLTKYALLLAFLVIIPITLLPSDFFVWVFGAEFSSLNVLIILLAPGVWVHFYALIMGHFFSGTGKYYVNTIASAAGFVALIPVLFLLVPDFHYYGAAISTTISSFITAVVIIIYFKKAGGHFVLFPGISEIISAVQNVKSLKL